MVYPTCAPARPPNLPPTGESSPNPIGDLVMQATAELSALREAYRAIACVHNLLLHVQGVPKGDRHVSHGELEALVALVDAELQRRMQVAKATITAMQGPLAI